MAGGQREREYVGVLCARGEARMDTTLLRPAPASNNFSASASCVSPSDATQSPNLAPSELNLLAALLLHISLSVLRLFHTLLPPPYQSSLHSIHFMAVILATNDGRALDTVSDAVDEGK